MHLLRTSVAALALLILAQAHSLAQAGELKLGMQTWTLRNLSFEQAVDFCARHHIKYLQLIPNHLDPNGTREEWQKKKELLETNGLVAYTFGVAGTSSNDAENRKLFECAKFFGMKLIIVEPQDFAIFDDLEKLAKEYDIRVAVHNHGITSLYGNPAVLRNILRHRDAHIGVCMDAGWIASSRFDPSRVFKEYGGRVFDIHLKDKKVECTDHGDRSHDTFLGEGDAKLPELLHTLKTAHWDGILAIETDNDLKDPTEHTEKAIQFFEKNSK